MCETNVPTWARKIGPERIQALTAIHPGIIRLRQVCELSGLGKSTVWERARSGAFPAPVKLGPNSTGWKKAEVLAWIESLHPSI